MRIYVVILTFFVVCTIHGQDYKTPFEISGKTATATYEECRDWYRNIQKGFSDIASFDSIGTGDEGFPIYVLRIYTAQNANAVKVLVLNNIHPGEPEGTDASMLLARDILENKKGLWNEVRNNIDIHIICQYNTDGTKNRGCCSRANQNGPTELGFRGNARNLDLNRDFIKCDSRNAQAFVKYFTKNKFQLFIDNHTSNGADYQYTLTWFHTRPEKLNPSLVPILNLLSSDLSVALNKQKLFTAPYVECLKETPDSGIVAFWESPRYSTGFAALQHCIGFTVETHMWKPFADRVNVTHSFMKELLQIAAKQKNTERIFNTWRSISFDGKIHSDRTEYIRWQLNEKRADSISFLGYEFSHPVHPLTGLPALHYDRSKPWKKTIPYYNYFQVKDSVEMPRVYVIPKAWREVLDLLHMNGIPSRIVSEDTLWPLRVSYITGYETVKTPYEGHYLHFNTSTKDTVVPVQIYAGDHLFIVTEANRKFLAAVLEPRSADSYFNWGFFDAMLQQKEWFSDYVWIDKAAEILEKNPKLKADFEREKVQDIQFAKNANAQLLWIYRRSEYYENTHNRIPVFRMD